MPCNKLPVKLTPTTHPSVPLQDRGDLLRERWAPLVHDVVIGTREIRAFDLRTWGDLRPCSWGYSSSRRLLPPPLGVWASRVPRRPRTRVNLALSQ